jgi:hypothetical protein
MPHEGAAADEPRVGFEVVSTSGGGDDSDGVWLHHEHLKSQGVSSFIGCVLA